jgi:hypothetical protein
VALPSEASSAEVALLRRALGAWEQAGLGVRFVDAAPGAAQIAVEFVPDDADYAATTESDCRVERAADAAAAGARLSARLVHARVELRRAQLDWRGRRSVLDEAQLQGAALHELGHALGFQGHAASGDTVMQRNVEHARDVGRAVLEGRPFRDATLQALYRVESGAVVARGRLPAGRSALADRLAELAAARGDGSLLVRVGDATGRIAFRDPEGPMLRVFLRHVSLALRDPARLELAADPELLHAARSDPP